MRRVLFQRTRTWFPDVVVPCAAAAALLLCLLSGGRPLRGDQPQPVRISEEPLVIPTYQTGPADPQPMFYMNESYQGAQKRIYPYPLQDHLIHERKDQTYTALRLENEFLDICVLPELGGRLFSATDKTNGYDFFYRQHVIKPALIGMLGAWISGGVEWCAFHHHRNTTFMPIDYTLSDNDDGSKTIWFGETERRHRMKWLIGLTLYPDRSYIEATIKFFNRTPLPHSILYWANVAVHVNDQYQVIFPPTVNTATYHSKIDFTHWPLAQGKYRGYDYTGKDISWWNSSPVSNSFFAWNLQEDFMGGYDHGRNSGVVHVGNHHVVCGAKLWEWGTGTVGRAWDNILTDEDGPYAELMVGAFSDNQPDYSWIKPHEVKTFKQYWYPIRDIGGFKNANLEAAVNLELRAEDRVFLGLQTTRRHKNAKVLLTGGTTDVLRETVDIGPDNPFTRELSLSPGTAETDLRVVLTSPDGKELIAYQPQTQSPADELPETVKAPPPPKDIESLEQLYLTGLRVEQIHNPRVDPMDYYQEALRRDQGDSRCNTMVGITYNRRGMYEDAERHLRRAVERLTQEYTRSRTGEAHFQLGLALLGQHRDEEAYAQFYRATWDQAWHAAAYFQLAALSARQRNWALALEQVDSALSTNLRDTKAQNLRAAILRKLGRSDEANLAADAVLKTDPLDFWARNERYQLARSSTDQTAARQSLTQLTRLMRDDVQAYLELATDYLHAGMLDEAIDVLQRPVQSRKRPAGDYPLLHYYLAYLHHQKGDDMAARESCARGASAPTDYCFPFRLETIDVLNCALTVNPDDARAEYYLGNLLFDHQPAVAMQHWDRSTTLDGSLAVAHRNLGWALYRVNNNITQAIDKYERALSCNQLEPRLFLELDMLYEAGNVAPQRRLDALQANHSIVTRREESFLREIMVLVLAGKYQQAIQYLEDNYFHAQEGRDEIHDVYVDAHLLEGIRLLDQGDAATALEHFEKAQLYPENLSVGRPKNDPRAPQVDYYTGLAHEALGGTEKARQQFTAAVDQQDTDRWLETRFYQALCLARLQRTDEADKVFAELIAAGKRQLSEDDSADFFAKFGQQSTRRSRSAGAHFLVGLGLLGQGEIDAARGEFKTASEMNLSHVWARYQLGTLPPQ